MKLGIEVIAGAESKQFLASLSKEIDRLDEVLGRLNAIEVEEVEEEKAPEPKRGRGRPKKKAAEVEALEEEDEDEDEEESIDDDESDDEDEEEIIEEDEDDDEEAEESDDEDEDEDEEDVVEEPVKKSARHKKLTVDDLNDVAKALASSIGGKAGRAKVLSLMKKHFDTESINDVKPEDYQVFVNVMRKAL